VRKRTLARILTLAALFQVDVGKLEPEKALRNVLDELDEEIVESYIAKGKAKKQEKIIWSVRSLPDIERILAESHEKRKHFDDQELRAFVTESFFGIIKHLEKLDASIEEKAMNWKLERVAKVEKNILRIALYEILFRSDIPTNVSIDEAVEMAKIFGDSESHRFVNGILGAVKTEEVKKDDRSGET
jgi:transcription antitermination protein NusB